MSVINVSQVTEAVARLCIDANYFINPDIKASYEASLARETNDMARKVTEILIENADIAIANEVPLCQDTGLAVVFIDIGQDVRLEGGDITQAINAGVAKGYTEGYLRKSVVGDPINRKNTGDNTPAVIHYNIVPGDYIEIHVAPKGFGSENMSAVKMLKPSDGLEGVEKFVIDTVFHSGSNPCPPLILGIGVGGTMEQCAKLAKQALLRDLSIPNPDPSWAAVEANLLAKINELGIGPSGFGGELTAMAVHIEAYPTHIAGLPVALNFGCHATRHAMAVLREDTPIEYHTPRPDALPEAPEFVQGGEEGRRLSTPFSQEDIDSLKAGEMVLISGHIYTARDAAHKRMVEMLERGEDLPIETQGQVVYYAGPSPTKPGDVIGSVGPTTSGRMDKYSPVLMSKGLKLMIGKGMRDEPVRQAITHTRGAYLTAIGGAAAYMARCVKEVELVAFEDLGTEAIRRLTVVDFPAIVAIDPTGNAIENA